MKHAIKTVLVLCFLSLFCQFIYGQGKYTAQNAQIQFFSKAPFENIEAKSNKVRGGIDTETNQILFLVPIKSFEFRKQLMQKHFNEQYLESDKFPTAKFEGSFSTPINFNEKKAYKFRGTITIHGVSKEIEDVVNITIDQNKIVAHSKFKLNTKDFEIKIPRIFIKNIAEEIEIEITTNLKQLNP